MSGKIEPLRTERIPLALIDEPLNPTRERMDADELEKLAHSLATRGQIQAIGLEILGTRFRIIYGHRRFRAAQLRHLDSLRADVYPTGVDYALAMQAGENAFREKVNAGEEGEWLLGIYRAECGEDLARLVEHTGLPEDRVSRHLLVAMGDPKVLDAVKAKRISASVALQLNRIQRADHRDYYLTHAINTGASEKLAKLWRAQSEQMAAADNTPPSTDTPPSTPSEPATAVVHMCACCGGTHDVHDMEYVQVHRYCNKAHLERLRKQLASTVVS